MGGRAAKYFLGHQDHCPLGTKDIPFNLVFGSDVVIPVEIGINTLRVAHFDPKKNESSLKANLNLLEKIGEDARMKATVR